MWVKFTDEVVTIGNMRNFLDTLNDVFPSYSFRFFCDPTGGIEVIDWPGRKPKDPYRQVRIFLVNQDGSFDDDWCPNIIECLDGDPNNPYYNPSEGGCGLIFFENHSNAKWSKPEISIWATCLGTIGIDLMGWKTHWKRQVELRTFGSVKCIF